MPISIRCPNCPKKLQVGDEAAGKKVRCPACKALVAVPEPEPEFVEPDDDLVEPEPESTAVTEKPASVNKKSASVKKGPPPLPKPKSEEEDYDVDEEDEEEREEIERKRRKKEKRKRREEADDRRRSYKPHRGVLILILGIVSIVIACAPLLTWILAFRVMAMASEDLSEMSARRMDPSGIGVTQTGKICAIVGSVLAIIWLVIAILLKILVK